MSESEYRNICNRSRACALEYSWDSISDKYLDNYNIRWVPCYSITRAIISTQFRLREGILSYTTRQLIKIIDSLTVPRISLEPLFHHPVYLRMSHQDLNMLNTLHRLLVRDLWNSWLLLTVISPPEIIILPVSSRTAQFWKWVKKEVVRNPHLYYSCELTATCDWSGWILH